MIEYTSILNELIQNLKSDYSQLSDLKSESIVKECFETKFKTSWDVQISKISCQVQDLINFLEIAAIIDQLQNTMETVKKYHAAHCLQELFKSFDDTFTVSKSDKFVEAKKEEKILKQKLQKHGISIAYINKCLNPNVSKKEISIPPRDINETYFHYLEKVLSHAFGDFEEMIKLYKKITPQKDWQIYDNLKKLAKALKTNGVDKTTDQLYDYLRKE